MVVAMAGFAIEDSIIKTLSERLAPGQVLIIIGIGGTSVFYVLAHIRNAGLTRSTVRDPWVIARSVSELLGTVFFRFIAHTCTYYGHLCCYSSKPITCDVRRRSFTG